VASESGVEAAPAADAEPLRLIVFRSDTSGLCRRVDAYLAQVLQHRQNHRTFRVVRVSVEEQPALAERFRVTEVPTLFVVEGRTIVRRITTPRSVNELESALAPWLR
jgi:thioredoxin-like negative regulator of GroEL